MAKYRKKEQYQVQLNDDQKMVIRSVIANMVLTPGTAWMVSRIKEMGSNALKPEMLPPREMQFERDVLRVMYNLADEGIAATESVVKNRLVLDDGDESRVSSKMRELMANRTEDRDVSGLSFDIADWIQHQKMQLAGLKIVERTGMRIGSALDAYREGLAIWNEVAPGDRTVTAISTDFMRDHRKLMEQRIARLESGGQIGPTFPWEGLRTKIPVLKKGDMTTIMAKSKHGKSVLTLLLAEHNAHVCRDNEGYDVAVFHCENSKDNLQDRWVARKLWVLMHVLTVPTVFNIKKEPYKTKYDKLQTEWEHNNVHRGRITYIHCPGLTVSELITQVSMYKAEAEARGRELLVIVDYFQAMDFNELNPYNETAAINAGADRLKRMAEAQDTNCYLIVLAQFGMDTDYDSRKAGYGGQKLNQRSQNVIRVERDDAKDDLPMLDKDGNQHSDLLGVPIFYHRIGDADARAWLNVIQSNDGQQGPVPVRFVGPYYACNDDKTRNATDYILEQQEKKSGKKKAEA